MRRYALDGAALRLESISKRYRLRVAPNARILDFGFWILDWAGKAVSGREPLTLSGNPKSKIQNPKWKEFWAVRDLSFSAQPGEVLGVIGSNGAGKSTLFKLIAGVTPPTSGWLAQQGRLGALIEVGAGIHPELTGRENIYQYGAILGLSWREIRQRFDAIVQFADLGGFIDQPVKRYSSGMHMRLGFSVAVHVEPDVLLVDEVLAVGDETYQARCLERIEMLRRNGTAILFVSHDMSNIERMCDRVIWLDHGRLVMSGPSGAAVAAYRAVES
jgi:homopolymeric O-antigen transport system ATP-binding protein